MCTNFEKSVLYVLDSFSRPNTVNGACSELGDRLLHLGGGISVRDFIEGLIYERYLVPSESGRYVLSSKGRKKKDDLSEVVRAA